MNRAWKSKTLGVTEVHESQLRAIKECLDFEREDDTYKFCLGYALAQELSSQAVKSCSRNTKWAMGNFDEGGDLLVLLSALFPDEEDLQSVLMERAETGIEFIHDKVTSCFIYSVSELLDS